MLAGIILNDESGVYL